MEEQIEKKSAMSGFIGGAIKLGIAALAIGAIAAGLWVLAAPAATATILGAGAGATITGAAGATMTTAAATSTFSMGGLGGLSGIWGAVTAGNFAAIGGALAAGKGAILSIAAVVGGIGAALGGAMGMLATNKYNNDVDAYQAQMAALNTPTQGLGRGKGREMDFSGVDTGIERTGGWVDRTRPQQPAMGAAPNVAQPVPR
jgi:hypothetical protein